MMLETLLGPFWVFLRFGDVPSTWTLAGGVVLLTSLFAHEIAAIREVRHYSRYVRYMRYRRALSISRARCYTRYSRYVRHVRYRRALSISRIHRRYVRYVRYRRALSISRIHRRAPTAARRPAWAVTTSAPTRRSYRTRCVRLRGAGTTRRPTRAADAGRRHTAPRPSQLTAPPLRHRTRRHRLTPALPGRQRTGAVCRATRGLPMPWGLRPEREHVRGQRVLRV